jgi:hypothetical protein
MKVFISWSGAVSQEIAIILRDWIPLVVPFAEPFVSVEDIDKGSRSLQQLTGQLKDSAFGILCVTKDNASEPWIHFEAGALSKALDSTHVCPLLFGLRPADLDRRSPLLQFQATAFEKADFLRLLKVMAKAGEPLGAPHLEKQFSVWWTQLEEQTSAELAKAAAAPGAAPHPPHKSRVEEMLEELLEHARNQARDDARSRTVDVASDSLALFAASALVGLVEDIHLIKNPQQLQELSRRAAPFIKMIRRGPAYIQEDPRHKVALLKAEALVRPFVGPADSEPSTDMPGGQSPGGPSDSEPS